MPVLVKGFVRGMVACGHHVEVCAQVQPGEIGGEELEDGVPVHRFANRVGGRRFGYAPALTRWIRRNSRRFDLVHAFSFHAPVALGVAIWVDLPMFFTPTYHGGGHTPLARAVHVAYRPASRIIVRRSRAIFSASEAERQLFSRDFPQARAKLVVVPAVVENALIDGAQPFVRPKPVILSAGRLDDYKRNDRLIEAFSTVAEQADLVICGDGPDRPRLDRLVTSLGVDGTVHLVGWVPDEELARWQRTARVVVSLSDHESFGLSLAEGAVAGANVVASDIPAHREVASMIGISAEFVDAHGDLDEVRQALRAALSKPRNEGPASRLTWESHARLVTDVYGDTLKGGTSFV